MGTNPFHVDAWDAARSHYDKQMQTFMVMLLRHFKVSQIEVDPAELLYKEANIEIRDLPNGKRFYRIVGEFQCDGDEGSQR